MFFLYYFFYGTSFAKVPWVYNSEISSLGWRTRSAAAATATNWMGGFIVTQFTKVGADNLGWRFYLRKFGPPTSCCGSLGSSHSNSLCDSLLVVLSCRVCSLPRDVTPNS